MKNYFKDKKIILVVLAGILLVVIIVFIFRIFKPSTTTISTQNKGINSQKFQGVIINDTVKIPDTATIGPNEGEIVPRGEYNVKIQPQSETDRVIVAKARLTLKEAYFLAKDSATNWAGDQKLVFIKSNGALNLEGQSSSWQLIFSSAQKNANYEIITEADKMISEKEIKSSSKGFDLPTNWYDSNEAIASLSNLPQFSSDTISAISFYYSKTAESWSYGLATDNGQKTTSMWVK